MKMCLSEPDKNAVFYLTNEQFNSLTYYLQIFQQSIFCQSWLVHALELSLPDFSKENEAKGRYFIAGKRRNSITLLLSGWINTLSELQIISFVCLLRRLLATFASKGFLTSSFNGWTPASTKSSVEKSIGPIRWSFVTLTLLIKCY
jgi:hypothetical protein